MSPLPDNLFSVCPQTKRLECSRLLEAADPDDQLYRYTMLRRRRRMLNEQPRLYFMHFWANHDAIKLAKGLRAALDNMANAESVGRSQETICEL